MVSPSPETKKEEFSNYFYKEHRTDIANITVQQLLRNQEKADQYFKEGKYSIRQSLLIFNTYCF
jgi:hypothetical protein